MDYAHKKTDGMLDSLEKRLAHEYAQAERELTDKLDDYMWRHSVKDRIWLNKVANGEITWERYQQWKIGQVCIGERWTEMRDTIAEDMHHTNEIAGSIVNGYLPEVYALNHNYATYEAEVGALVDTSYTLYDRQTVERMMRDNPDMLPPPGKRVSERIRAGKDVRWNEQQLQSITTQAILQGEGIPQLAGRIQSTFGDSFTIEDIRDIEHKTASQIAHELTKKNKSAAVRNARTMMTGAQNAGRVDGYKRAKDMGIDLRQQWLATLDGRTRHEHRQLDGQIVDVGEPFKVDGYEIRFPGDPTAEAHLVYNCRCTLIAAIKGFEHDLSDTSSRYDANLEGMTYEEWKKAKEPKRERPEKIFEQFVPAKTKQEAIDFAKRFAKSVNLTGVSLENANKINEQLLYLTQKYPTNQLEQITNKSSGIMSASYRSLNISGRKLGSALSDEELNFGLHRAMSEASIRNYRERYGDKMPWDIQRRIEKLENGLRFTRWGVHSSYENHVQAVVTHEYGHILADQYFGMSNKERANPNYANNWQLRNMTKRWEDALKKSKETGDIYKLSDYGSTNAAEFFAESFLAREMGEPLPDYVESLMLEVLNGGVM